MFKSTTEVTCRTGDEGNREVTVTWREHQPRQHQY
jgi:hypothetical protein